MSKNYQLQKNKTIFLVKMTKEMSESSWYNENYGQCLYFLTFTKRVKCMNGGKTK